MNKKPDLEWRQISRRAPIWLWTVLLGTLVTGAWLFTVKTHQAERAAELDRALEQVLTRELAGPVRPVLPESARSPAELRQIRTQIALLNRDWPSLFDDLLPDKPQVKLLGLEINGETAAIRLTAHAPSADIANDYAEALQAQRRQVQDVKLLLLERKPEGLHFEVSARWVQ